MLKGQRPLKPDHSRSPQSQLSARQAALNLLGAREYSRYSLERKLLEKAYPPEEILPLLDEFESLGWLDDARYARLYIRSRINKGHGPVRIRADIAHKGISQQLFQTVLQQLEYDDGIDWYELCQQAYAKKYYGKSLPKERTQAYKERAKRQRYLAYRGFSADQIQFALSPPS